MVLLPTRCEPNEKRTTTKKIQSNVCAPTGSYTYTEQNWALRAFIITFRMCFLSVNATIQTFDRFYIWNKMKISFCIFRKCFFVEPHLSFFCVFIYFPPSSVWPPHTVCRVIKEKQPQKELICIILLLIDEFSIHTSFFLRSHTLTSHHHHRIFITKPSLAFAFFTWF